jgi:lipopolysaccharide/colanic/teichoic acid biosynthesis glycosyltransferase
MHHLIERPLALIGLLALGPLFLLIAFLIKTTSPGPVVHRRRVVGQYGVSFDAYKFRTMVMDADRILEADAELRQAYLVNHKLEDDPRVTRVGRVLRKYSLDELPQLANVLRGEMALIGPRMITPQELTRYGDHALRLMSVKPGLTGLWQVSGRQTTSYDRRVELDMEYIENWHPVVDLSILFRTVAEVVRARGAF